MYSINQIFQLADNYEKKCIIKFAKIRKLPNNKYRVLSKKNKNLGTFDTKAKAKKHLAEVEYFKHKDHNNSDDKSIIDLTKADDYSYSAIMRELRQNASKEQVRKFLILFKNEFDKAVKNKLQNQENVALQNSLVKFNKIHKIKLNKKLIKNAAVAELGDARRVGKYLSDIVKFTITRIPLEKRQKTISNLRKKIYTLNANELAQKHSPPTASIGQAISFIKFVLLNQDPIYIRSVLNAVVSNL